jgi:hypothetical protein
MAKVTQVVLVGCKSYADNRRKFKQNTPVTMRDEKEVERYRGNALFAVREVDEAKANVGVSAQKVNPGDPFKTAVNEQTTRLPGRKKKTSKKLTPKQGE